MKPINDENIDEIMFQLIEGEINGPDREILLQAIHSDPSYSALWKAWQNTVIQSEEISFNNSHLKRKQSTIIPLYFKYAAAIALIFGLLFLLNKETIKTEEFVVLPPKIKTFKNPLPQIQKDSTYNSLFIKDTFLSIKEKVKFMAIKAKPNSENYIETKDSISINYFTEKKIKIDTQSLFAPLKIEQKFMGVYENEILVDVSNDKLQEYKVNKNLKTNFLSKLLGKSSIKIVADQNTRTKRKIIFENKKYQIIAGF